MRILLAAPLFLFPVLALAQQQTLPAPDLLRPLKDAETQHHLQQNFLQASPNFLDSGLHRALKNMQQPKQLMLNSELNRQTVCSVPLREMEIPKDRDFTMLVVPMKKAPDDGPGTVRPPAPPCDRTASERNILFPQERR